MKTLLLTAALATSVLLAASVLAADKPAKDSKKDKSEKAEKKSKNLRHVVSFKWKEGTSQDQIDRIVDAFAALEKKIPQIKSFEWGVNNSPEKLNKGFTHTFFLTFKTEQDRETYLVHPDHKEFGKLLGPVLGDVMVVDYWAKK